MMPLDIPTKSEKVAFGGVHCRIRYRITLLFTRVGFREFKARESQFLQSHFTKVPLSPNVSISRPVGETKVISSLTIGYV